MNEWLFRRRDPAAVVITLACMGLLLTAHGLQPMRPAQPPVPIETEVSLIDELEPLPSAAPAPNRPETASIAKPAPVISAAPSPVAPPQTPSPPVTPPTAAPQAAAQSSAQSGRATDAQPAPPAPPAAAGPAIAESSQLAVQAAAPSPPMSSSARGAEDVYRAELRVLLNSIKRYPNSREARQLRPQGVVKLWIDIERNGQLLGVGVETSSGTLLLDNEALRTVRSGRFPAFPADAFGNQTHHRFVLPIEYTVENG